MTAVEALLQAIAADRVSGRSIRLACLEAGVDLHTALALTGDHQALAALFA